jgi:hypothetical protein
MVVWTMMIDGRDVGIALIDLLHVPAIGFEALAHVLGEGERGGAVEGDTVVVVEPHQLAQAEVAGQRSGLVGDALHQVAVADQGVGHVVHDLVAWLVVAAGQEALGDGHAHGVAGALPKRAGGGLDARRAEGLGMAGGARAPLAEGLELVERQVVAVEVQHRVEQHRAVTGREHETVAVGPLGVLRIVA